MLDPNKIAFIYCYNDEQQLNKSLSYLEDLIVPSNMIKEVITLHGQTSATSGYNNGMKQAGDAKYKVYLHQDVHILNVNFISDLIDIFSKDEEIGMIGMIGAQKLNADAVWWFSDKLYGKVYDNTRGERTLLSFVQPKGNYAQVEAIDGLLMATQYDVPWREDLFTGWHFYDISQTWEFLNAGYKVIVPKQAGEAWCYHDAGHGSSAGGYDEFKKVFKETYFK